MEVYFYSFSKRNKSTKVVNDPTHITLDCKLKDNTSVTKPILEIGSVANIQNCNYVYIPTWNRYYFITESTSINNIWQVNLEEDYLASHKVDIGTTNAMIIYATGSTKNIIDSRIPVQSEYVRNHNSTPIEVNGQPVLFDNAYSAIIGVTGLACVGQYLLDSPLYISELLDGIDQWSITNITDVVEASQQLFFGGSAGQCLKSVIGLPWVVPLDVQGNLENIYLGSYPCKDSNGNFIQGHYLKPQLFTYDEDIAIPWTTSTDWLMLSQYTTVTMYLPLVGLVQLNATDMKDDDNLTVTYSVYAGSGEFSVSVKGKESGVEFYTGGGSCAFRLPYGSTGYDFDKLNAGIVAGVGTGIATVAGAVASGGISVSAELAMGGAMASVVGGTISAMSGRSEGSAGGGGGVSTLGLGTEIHIWITQKKLSDTQANLDAYMGKPFMAKAQINSINGYVQTDGFQLESNWAYSSERDMVNRLLDSGIYYE